MNINAPPVFHYVTNMFIKYLDRILRNWGFSTKYFAAMACLLNSTHLKCFKYKIFTNLVRLLLVVDASPWNVRHAQGGHQSAREHAPHVLRPPHVEGGAPRLPHQGVPGAPGHLTITRVQPPHTGWQQNVSFQGYNELFLISTPRGPQMPATEFHSQ